MSDWPIDWRTVVDEAIRRRKAEGLTQRGLAALAGVSAPTVNAFEQGDIHLRFERVVAILEALDLIVQPGRPDSFQAFIHGARRRWEELTARLPKEHLSRQPLGHSEQAYCIEHLPKSLPLERLRDALSKIPKSSGWTPFWVPTRPDIRPTVQDGLLECWLGKPDIDRQFNDPAHSDFWQVTRQGFAYLQRGYQEDGPDNLEPGTIFDVTLPIWRTAEVLLHASNLARALGAEDNAPIRFVGRYTGLEGRELISWAKPLLRHLLDERFRARSTKVDLDVVTTAQEIDNALEAVVAEAIAPLYERFDGYRPPVELIETQIAELRRQPTFGVRR
jgi:transcriptional regulator with XRE-family HTH domain